MTMSLVAQRGLLCRKLRIPHQLEYTKKGRGSPLVCMLIILAFSSLTGKAQKDDGTLKGLWVHIGIEHLGGNKLGAEMKFVAQ